MDLKRSNSEKYDYSIPVTRTVDVTPATFLWLEEDGSKILRLDINDHHCIQHTDHHFHFDVDVAFTPKYVARCILAKDSQEIKWDSWDNRCPQWILDEVKALYTNEEMVVYINNITDIRK